MGKKKNSVKGAEPTTISLALKVLLIERENSKRLQSISCYNTEPKNDFKYQLKLDGGKSGVNLYAFINFPMCLLKIRD